MLADFKPRFAGVNCGKSCLRFKRPEQVDAEAVADLLRAVRSARAAEDG